MIAIRSIAIIAVATLLQACGPIKQPPARHFVVVIHNKTTSNEKFRVRVALNGVYYYDSELLCIPFGDVIFVTGNVEPELVEVYTVAWQTAWQTPDYAGHQVLHIYYPVPQIEVRDN